MAGMDCRRRDASGFRFRRFKEDAVVVVSCLSLSVAVVSHAASNELVPMNDGLGMDELLWRDVFARLRCVPMMGRGEEEAPQRVLQRERTLWPGIKLTNWEHVQALRLGGSSSSPG